MLHMHDQLDDQHPTAVVAVESMHVYSRAPFRSTDSDHEQCGTASAAGLCC